MLPEAESDAYFGTRPRGSQIGAWMSNQSTVIASREVLEERAKELMQEYEDETVPIPRPVYWGGYVVKPVSIEFWQGRPSRLHDRIRYKKAASDSNWEMERLSP